MLVKLREKAKPTIEAWRLDDDNLPAIIRKAADVVKTNISQDGRLNVWWDSAPHAAWEGEYIVFSGKKKVEVLSAEEYVEKYETAGEDGDPWDWEAIRGEGNHQGPIVGGFNPDNSGRTYGRFSDPRSAPGREYDSDDNY